MKTGDTDERATYQSQFFKKVRPLSYSTAAQPEQTQGFGHLTRNAWHKAGDSVHCHHPWGAH